MSKILKDTFSSIFKIGSYFAKKKLLSRESGARLANNKELSSIFSRSNKGLLINGNDQRISLTDSYEHLAVIAKPGSGKTTAFIVPNVLELGSKECSMIINDPSGEIFQLTSGYLEKQGYRIQILNPENLEQSARFNPFAGLTAQDTMEIEQICTSIIMTKYGADKEPIWNEGAISILEVLAKCLSYSQTQELNLVELNSLITLFGSDGRAIEDWVAENSINPQDYNDRTLWQSWLGIISSNEKMLSSYVTICKTALKQLSNPNIQKLLCSDTLNLQEIRRQKTVIYLNFSEAKQGYYQFIIDLFYIRLISTLMQKKPTVNELDIFGLLDEFGNSYIHEFNISINNLRKYRVSLSLIFQGISQLSQKYGEQTAKAIKSGIGSYLIYRGGDLDTNSEFSQILGNKFIHQKESFGNIVESRQEQQLLAPDQIRMLQDNEAIYISKNYPAAILNCTKYFEHGRYRRLTKNKPACSTTNKFTLNFDSKLRI